MKLQFLWKQLDPRVTDAAGDDDLELDTPEETEDDLTETTDDDLDLDGAEEPTDTELAGEDHEDLTDEEDVEDNDL